MLFLPKKLAWGSCQSYPYPSSRYLLLQGWSARSVLWYIECSQYIEHTAEPLNLASMRLYRPLPETSTPLKEDILPDSGLNISISISNPIMVETMSQPLTNTWAPQPSYSRYYPQELPGPVPRLPPISSAVDTRGPDYQAPPAHHDPRGSQSSHHGFYARDNPQRQLSPHSPIPPRGDFPSVNHDPRYAVDRSNRFPSTSSSSVTSRMEGDVESNRSYPQMPGRNSFSEARYQSPSWPNQEARHEQGHRFARDEVPRPMEYQSNSGAQVQPGFRPQPLSNRPLSPRAATRQPKRVGISDLLSNDQQSPSRKQSIGRPITIQSPITPSIRFNYTVSIRQQPIAARSCGFGERDRRVIDPPPIVELKIEDPAATPEDIRRGLEVPFSVVHCTIWNEAGDEDISFMPEEYRQQRRLMGTTVASPFNGRDENGREGCFFCFPDLSVRTAGTFRLRFVMVMVDPMANFIGARHPVRAQTMSEVFTVYSAKDFPGMQASTPLTKKLKEQGCLISIKKGNDRGGRSRDSDEEDDDDDNASGSAITKRKKQRK